MKDTQEALMEFENLRLHKFASNDPNVMSAFPSDDLPTSLNWVVIHIPQESKVITMVFLHYEAMEHMLNVSSYSGYSVYITQRNLTKFEECSIPPQNLMEYH
jgi:hypothetical protein